MSYTNSAQCRMYCVITTLIAVYLGADLQSDKKICCSSISTTRTIQNYNNKIFFLFFTAVTL